MMSETKGSVKKPVKRASALKKQLTKKKGEKKELRKAQSINNVAFRLPKVAAPDAKSVCIVGDFNNWNIHANPMKKLKNGDYTVKLALEKGMEYQFRYLIDEIRWENDWNADKYVRSPYGDVDNSVVIV